MTQMRPLTVGRSQMAGVAGNLAREGSALINPQSFEIAKVRYTCNEGCGCSPEEKDLLHRPSRYKDLAQIINLLKRIVRDGWNSICLGHLVLIATKLQIATYKNGVRVLKADLCHTLVDVVKHAGENNCAARVWCAEQMQEHLVSGSPLVRKCFMSIDWIDNRLRAVASTPEELMSADAKIKTQPSLHLVEGLLHTHHGFTTLYSILSTVFQEELKMYQFHCRLDNREHELPVYFSLLQQVFMLHPYCWIKTALLRQRSENVIAVPEPLAVMLPNSLARALSLFEMQHGSHGPCGEVIVAGNRNTVFHVFPERDMVDYPERPDGLKLEIENQGVISNLTHTTISIAVWKPTVFREVQSSLITPRVSVTLTYREKQDGELPAHTAQSLWDDAWTAWIDLKAPSRNKNGTLNNPKAGLFPATVLLNGLTPLSDALAGRKEWTDRDVIHDVNEFFDNPGEYVKEWEVLVTSQVKKAWKLVQRLEKDAFGERSYFTSNGAVQSSSRFGNPAGIENKLANEVVYEGPGEYDRWE